MKKIETHCHISPISCCSRLTAEQCVKKYKECAFDAITVTNHYSRGYIEANGIDEKQWLDLYIKEFYNTEKAAKDMDMEAYLGAEVTLFAPYSRFIREKYSPEFIAANYADYLLFGITEKFLRSSPVLCDLDLKDLRSLCHENGVLLVQAHPFRTEQHHSLKDVTLLDGLEINGCCGFETACEKQVLKVAKENSLIVTCGGDTHYDWHKLRSATFVPDEVCDALSLAAYLKKVRIPEYSITLDDPFAPPKKN